MKYKNYVLWIFLSLLAGILGSYFTTPAIPVWYASLNKPFFNPPSWIFGPVWTMLYILMGTAMAIIANIETKLSHIKNKAYILFSLQLFLNFLWSILFFGLRSPLSAFIEIIILFTVIILTIVYFFKLSKTAAYLFFPYVLWVGFALILNAAIVMLN
ncbi:TspO/MBR family protein [Thermoproteota archaeon]